MGNIRAREKVRDGFLGDLPDDLQTKVMNIHRLIKDAVNSTLENSTYDDLKESRWAMSCIDDFCAMPKDKTEIGSVRVYKRGKTYRCMIQVTGHFVNHQYGWIEELLHDFIGNVFSAVRPKVRRQYDMTMTNEGKMGNAFEGFDIFPDPKTAKMIWEMFEDRKTKTIMENGDNTSNTDMTEAQAKKTLRTLSQDIINKTKNDKNYKVTQYTANIYANIITKNLLPKWSSGYKKLSITLDSYQSFFTFEFKIPNMSQDFISRFINGREPINAFLHRIPEIRIKMSPRIFHTMENPDDAYNFFKAAVKYYDSKIEKYSRSLTSEIMKLNHSMKHLISTTKLSGIVTYPMQLLFVFDDVHMNNPKTFELSDSDIKAINQFIKNIYSRYAAPEKEKKQIIEDVKEMVKELREACDHSDNMRDLYYLPEAVETYLFGGYNDLIERANWIFENDQVDIEATNTPKDPEVKYLQEKFGVKKLKKIPTDLVAYITIETEAIETPNDKMMIASYCLSKIEIVEWYIELLEVGSKKYVVPHSKPYLENIRTQLLACYKKIMDTKVSTNKDRPIIDIQYPKGYEG